MKKYLYPLIVALALTACGLSDKELFDTAQFEEKQGNRPHAVQLYKELVAKHPNSQFRAQAEERLKALEPAK